MGYWSVGCWVFFDNVMLHMLTRSFRLAPTLLRDHNTRHENHYFIECTAVWADCLGLTKTVDDLLGSIPARQQRLVVPWKTSCKCFGNLWDFIRDGKDASSICTLPCMSFDSDDLAVVECGDHSWPIWSITGICWLWEAVRISPIWIDGLAAEYVAARSWLSGIGKR